MGNSDTHGGKQPEGDQEVVLGLHMIVKDEEQVIGRCLEAILPGVDRALILDTGSTDDTEAKITEAALECGWHTAYDSSRIRVRSMEWPDDFGKARQRSLDLLLEEWPEVTHVVWADADDVVMGGEHLRAYAAALPEGSPGWMAHYAYGFGPSGELTVSHYRERILRVSSLKRWEGAIHENLLVHPGPWTPLPVPTDSQLRAPWPRDPGGVEWVHDPPPGERNLDRNRFILEADLKREREEGRPTVRTLGYLAQEYSIKAALTEDESEKATWLDQAADAYALVGNLGVQDEQTYQLRHRHADLERQRGNHRTAQLLDEANVKQLPAWPDAWIGLAATHAELDEFELALSYVDVGLSKPYPQTGLILNPTDYTIAPRVIRAACLRGLGRLDEALDEIGKAQAQSPQDPRLASLRQGYADEVNRARTKDALLALDEALARNDENLNALAVLEAAPHFLRADPEVVQRRNRRRLGLRHLSEPLTYQRWYQEGAGGDAPFKPEGERTMRETVTWAAESLGRTQFLLAGLRERHGDDLSGAFLLDVGCNDGWLGYWLTAEHGLGRYVGLDLFPAAIERAEKLGEEHYPEVLDRVAFLAGDLRERVDGLPSPRLVTDVSCFEVIEHVPDVDDWVSLLASRTEDGQVYLSTPNGSYERGHISDWDSPTLRGHVRAMRPQELTELALDHGVLEGFTTHEDRTMCVAFTPLERIGTVDLFLGPAGQSWSPYDTIDKGLGGSETMAVRLASRLSDMGWRVRVFCAVDAEAVMHGVEYKPWWMHDPSEPVDALIVSRIPSYLRDVPPAPGTFTALWLHDAEYGDLDAAGVYDLVWCVGRWQRQELFPGGEEARWYAENTPVAILRNGVGLSDYEAPALSWEDREPRVVYSSSPDRGLANLLDVWPTVYENCVKLGVTPTLTIAYGFTSTYELAAQSDPRLVELRAAIENACASMPGVNMTGSIGQPELHRLQRTSRVWAYPTDFPEVSCITAMEAQMAGMAVLATDVAELERTCGNANLLWPPHAEWTDEDRDSYIGAMVGALTQERLWETYVMEDPDDARRRWNADGPAEQVHAELAANVSGLGRRWNGEQADQGDEPA